MAWSLAQAASWPAVKGVHTGPSTVPLGEEIHHVAVDHQFDFGIGGKLASVRAHELRQFAGVRVDAIAASFGSLSVFTA